MSQQQPPSESPAAAAQREALVQACGEHGGAEGGTAKCEGRSCGGCELCSCKSPALCIRLSTPPPSCPNPHHSADGSHTTAEGSVLPSPLVLQAAGGSVGGSAGCVSDLLELAATTHKLLGGARRFLQWAVGAATTSGADGYTVGGECMTLWP